MNKQSIEQHILSAAKQAGGVFRSRYGIWLVAMISFVESALPVPLITDPFMTAHILVNRSRVYTTVLVTTVSSVLGGLLAYITASVMYLWLVDALSPGAVAELNAIVLRFQEGTFLITLLGAITPIPYTFVAIGAGFVQGNLLLFLLASILGRSLRYATVGYVVYWYGPETLKHAKKNLRLATLVSILLVIAYLYYKLGNM